MFFNCNFPQPRNWEQSYTWPLFWRENLLISLQVSWIIFKSKWFEWVAETSFLNFSIKCWCQNFSPNSLIYKKFTQFIGLILILANTLYFFIYGCNITFIKIIMHITCRKIFFYPFVIKIKLTFFCLYTCSLFLSFFKEFFVFTLFFFLSHHTETVCLMCSYFIGYTSTILKASNYSSWAEFMKFCSVCRSIKKSLSL